MDAIKTFDVEIDVSNSEKLYDYGFSKYYHRPADGQWDYSMFAIRREHTDAGHGDENRMVRVDKMDKILHRSKCMEKRDKNEQEGNPKWNDFDFMHSAQKLPNRVLPVFHPGDTINGYVLLQLSQPLEAESLKIFYQGQAMTLVRVYHGRGHADIKGRDVYLKEERLVWQKDEKGTDEVSDTFALLSTSDSPLKSKTLPAGDHKFHFEFNLPSDCPGSTPNLLPTSWSDYAYVLHRVKAKIDTGKTFSRDPVTFKGIWIDQKMDIATERDDMNPFSLDESLDTGIALWKGGKVSCTTKLPRRAFVRGEDVPVTLEIDNQASEEISGVVAQVLLRGKGRTGTSKMSVSHSINLKGKKVKESGFTGLQSRVYQLKVPLDFSEAAIDSNLIPAGTLSDCPLIDVKYDLVIKVKRPGLHRNIEMDIPIKIGNRNSSTETSATGMYPQLH